MAQQTPKEKAKELVEKYAIWTWNEIGCDYYLAKQCAIIAVDEILNHCSEGFKPFLRDVKEEINKL